jgi:hypothetical protein
VGRQRHTISYDTQRFRSRALNLRIYTSWRPAGDGRQEVRPCKRTNVIFVRLTKQVFPKGFLGA